MGIFFVGGFLSFVGCLGVLCFGGRSDVGLVVWFILVFFCGWIVFVGEFVVV